MHLIRLCLPYWITALTIYEGGLKYTNTMINRYYSNSSSADVNLKQKTASARIYLMGGVICALDRKFNAYCWSDLRFSADCTTVIKDLNPLTQVAAVSESLATRSRLLFPRPWMMEKQQSSLSIGGRCGSLACFFSACRPARLKMSGISNPFETNDHSYLYLLFKQTCFPS